MHCPRFSNTGAGKYIDWESLNERAYKHQTIRQEILIEMARLRGQKEMSLSKLGKKNIAAFCSALKERFLDKVSNFGKEYLDRSAQF